ncbi:hypothetical protein [Blastomonas sp.]|uniref:hypothetical protein n=1 Tax=Blastomonas sp. TaxID=1909299 RepID=UPI002628C2CC|nr:hypothetical protein [Blastomonas sp.]MDM7955314.1 hypothetical protein [Blastomonas sp.]
MKREPTHLRVAVALLIGTALAHAPFAQADAQMIAVGNCNGGMSLLVIPGEDGDPGKGGNDCAKACHGTCERRSKTSKRAS